MAGEKVELATAYLTLVPSLRGANDELRRELNPALAAGIGAGIGTVLATGIGRGISAVGSLIPDAIAAGGSLEQSIGAIDSVFKGSAGQMHAWAQSAAVDVGLTRDEYNGLGSLIGSQLKNGGTAMDELAPKTRELIGTGADLASMFGGTTQEAVSALSSALKGERDPIERYGVSLSQAKIDAEAASLGFEKVGGALSAEATQAATLSLIMKQTQDAHGNFAKEADTTAHKQEVLRASWGNAVATLGTSLLPVMSAVLPIFQGMVDAAGPLAQSIGGGLTTGFQNLSAALPGVIGFVTQFQGAFIGAGIAIGVVAAITGVHAAVMAIQSGAMLAAITNMGIVRGAVAAWTAVQWVLNAALSANPIGIVVVLIAGLIAAVVWAYNNVGWFRDGVNTAWRTISSVTIGVLGAAGAFFRGLWSGITSFGRGVIQGFIGFVTGSWSNVRNNTTAMLGAAGSFFRGLWSGAISFGRGVIQGFISFVVGGWSNIVGNTRANFGAVSAFIGGIWGGITSGASRAVGGVIGFFSGLPGRIRGAIGDAWGVLSGIGSRIIDGFLGGLKASWGGVTDFVGGIAGWIRDNKGPESKDRKLLTPAGQWIMGGLAASLQSSLPMLEPPLQAAAARIAGQTFGIGRSQIAPRAGGGMVPAGAGRGMTTINVSTSDPETASELTARKLNRGGM